MAISFSGNAAKYYSLQSSSTQNWSGITQGTQLFRLRIDGGSPGNIGGGSGSSIMFGKLLADYYHIFYPSAGPAFDLRFYLTNDSGAASYDVSLLQGAVYPIILKWDGIANHQTLILAGITIIFGSFTGPTSVWAHPLELGLLLANANIDYTIDALAILDEYLTTDAEDLSYLNGGSPAGFGPGAPWRGYYPFNGTIGNTPVHTDVAMQNAIDGTLNFESETGTGTAIYSAPLVWSPTVTAQSYVAGCSKNIGFTFTSDLDGSLQIPSQLLSIPMITVNGVNHGALTIPWGGHLTGVHQCMLFSTPGTPPLSIGPTDVVELTAPSAWANTPSGPVAALSGTIDNRSGRSSVLADRMTRTLRLGVGVSSDGLSWFYPFKNAKYTMGQPGNLGKVAPGGYKLVDQPWEAGLVLLVWDATNPLTPAVMSLQTGNSATVTVTHLAQYDVYPPDGIGCRAVYEIAYVDGSDYETVSGGTLVYFVYTDPAYTGVSNYDNLWIYLAGEWLFDGGGNPVFDRSDEFAISNIHLDRVPQNVGSIRSLGNVNAIGTTNPYPELMPPRDIEFFWGYQLRILPDVGFLSMGPVDTTATPWIYSAFFRAVENQFSATLTDTISTTPAVGTNETWHFSDGATTPLMAGLEIQIDSEVCRLISGSGTDWVVYRGSNGTTPATHAPGTVIVYGRQPVTTQVQSDGTLGYAAPIFFQCDKPHGMTSLHGYYPQGTYSATMIDNATETTFDEPTVGLGISTYITGPTSFIAIWGGYYTSRPAGARLSQTYTLNPANNYFQRNYSMATPLEVFCEHVGKYPSADIHINIPLDACDDMVWTYARIVRDHFPAGRKVVVEWVNEPWNWAAPFHTNLYCLTMGPMAIPSTVDTSYGLSYYPYRAAQMHAIFRTVFTAVGRGGEIVGGINCQPNSGSTQITPSLSMGLAIGQPFDAVMTAPYFTVGMSGNGTAATLAAFDQYDDDQGVEMGLHDLYYDTTSMIFAMKNDAAAVTAYNVAHNKNCIIMSYECGWGQLAPYGANNQYGRQHDLCYNPNVYHLWEAYFKLAQDIGFQRFEISILGYGWPDAYYFYHARTQKHSLGDGLNGAADNRALRMETDLIGNSYLKQDRRADSPGGQTFIDWLESIVPDTTEQAVVTQLAALLSSI